MSTTPESRATFAKYVMGGTALLYASTALATQLAGPSKEQAFYNILAMTAAAGLASVAIFEKMRNNGDTRGAFLQFGDAIPPLVAAPGFSFFVPIIFDRMGYDPLTAQAASAGLAAMLTAGYTYMTSRAQREA